VSLVRGGVVVGLGAGDQCRYVFVFSDRATVEEGVPSSNKQACLSGGNKLKWKAVWLAKGRKGGRYERRLWYGKTEGVRRHEY
jgi:hypothetical protein